MVRGLVDQRASRAYIGQFTPDGAMFIGACGGAGSVVWWCGCGAGMWWRGAGGGMWWLGAVWACCRGNWLRRPPPLLALSKPRPPTTATAAAAYQHDRKIRLYDVAAGFKLVKDVHARNLQWTVTGKRLRPRVVAHCSGGIAGAGRWSSSCALHCAVPTAVPAAPSLPHVADIALSADARFLLYASIAPEVHLVNVAPGGMGGSEGVESGANVTDIHEALDFAGAVRGVVWVVRGVRAGWE